MAVVHANTDCLVEVQWRLTTVALHLLVPVSVSDGLPLYGSLQSLSCNILLVPSFVDEFNEIFDT